MLDAPPPAEARPRHRRGLPTPSLLQAWRGHVLFPAAWAHSAVVRPLRADPPGTTKGQYALSVPRGLGAAGDRSRRIKAERRPFQFGFSSAQDETESGGPSGHARSRTQCVRERVSAAGRRPVIHSKLSCECLSPDSKAEFLPLETPRTLRPGELGGNFAQEFPWGLKQCPSKWGQHLDQGRATHFALLVKARPQSLRGVTCERRGQIRGTRRQASASNPRGFHRRPRRIAHSSVSAEHAWGCVGGQLWTISLASVSFRRARHAQVLGVPAQTQRSEPASKSSGQRRCQRHHLIRAQPARECELRRRRMR